MKKNNINTIFLMQNLETVGLYLGYNRKFRSSYMFCSLLGNKNDIDIYPISLIQQQLTIVYAIIKSIQNLYGTLWIIAPLNGLLYGVLNQYKTFLLLLLKKRLVLWLEKWLPGTLTNKMALKPVLKRYKYPSTAFYPAYSSVTNTFNDVVYSNILKLGVIDSNARKSSHTFCIPSNEKTTVANKFFTNLIVKLVVYKIIFKKVNFFNNSISKKKYKNDKTKVK